MREQDRGQAYTLEGVIAAIILASAVLYGLQAVDVAPYTSDDRSERQLENLRIQTSDALDVAKEKGALERAVTCIDNSTGEPHDRIGQRPNPGGTGGNLTALGGILNATLEEEERQYVVRFDYWNTSDPHDGALNSTYVHPNNPGTLRFTRNPVTVTERVVLFNSTAIREPNDAGTPDDPSDDYCRRTGETVGSYGDGLYLEEAHATTDREPYAVVTVRVIAW